uniref:DUF674 domain-containing protein n=1 Tax=Leersia perrieri TaxID=77586 RepID=A0A0D9UWW3_9ORYZ
MLKASLTSNTVLTGSTGMATMQLKLLVDTRSQRVLYAEAGKDAVDFLLSLLTLPLATVSNLLAAHSSMPGSLTNLYPSVDTLDDAYLVSGDAKLALLLHPGATAHSVACNVLRLTQRPAPGASSMVSGGGGGCFYRCSGQWYEVCGSYVAKACGVRCPSCEGVMASKLQLVGAGDAPAPATAPAAFGDEGFVQGLATYMITDDLKVSPLSSISGITLLGKFGVTHIGELEEKTVQLGYNEWHAEHEAAGGHQGEARAVRGGQQGRRRLPLLPPHLAVGTVGKDSKFGSIAKLHGSVEELGACRNLPPLALSTETEVYRCSSLNSQCYNCVSMVSGVPCQIAQCNGKMIVAVKLVMLSNTTTGSNGGEVPSAVAGTGLTYTIMDDLKVAPMSTVTLIKSGVSNIKSLQEKTVQIGYTEGLSMLKASLQLKTVLTDVFLGRKRKKCRDASGSPMSMTLLVDTTAQRVLYAEAGKDVVDFLFSLALPVGMVVKLLGKDSMVGCVSDLYASVEKLDDTYVLADAAAKDALLNPVVLSPAATSKNSVLRLPAPRTEQPKSFFRCVNSSYSACRSYVTDASGTKCPTCHNQMTTACSYVEGAPDQIKMQKNAAHGAKGFVQGIVTYTVMDDLTVAPMSSISSITLLNKFAVKDLGALKEQTVQLGYTEGLAILKASLQSNTDLDELTRRCAPCLDSREAMVLSLELSELDLFPHPLQPRHVIHQPVTEHVAAGHHNERRRESDLLKTGALRPERAAFGAGTSASSTPDAGCRCSACLAAAHGGKGFVRDVVTYTVMDDLTFMPMSSISSFALLSKLGVEDLSALEEKTVKIGYQEGLEILKASLQSKTVLTDVFMNNRKKRRAGDKHHRPGDKIVDARAPVEKKDAAGLEILKASLQSETVLTDVREASSAPMSMTLLVDSTAQRVLYAEDGKDVVDFLFISFWLGWAPAYGPTLFSLVALPVGMVVKLLGKDSMVGCVSDLYASVEKLDDTYVLADAAAKDALLNPVVLSPAATSKNSVLRLPAPRTEQPKSFFRCVSSGYSSCRSYVTDASGAKCPTCEYQMTTACSYVEGAPDQIKMQKNAAHGTKGFVQGIVTYTVMDDLTVAPVSSISSITLLNKFAVKDLGALKEQTVQLGYTEGLAILKASLQSNTVLTDVFIGLKKKPATLCSMAGGPRNHGALPRTQRARPLYPSPSASPHNPSDGRGARRRRTPRRAPAGARPAQDSGSPARTANMGNAATVPSSCATADAAPSTTAPTIKLLIAKEAQVVLFAEASKDVVDFLVGLLAMPVGAVVKLLAGENALGGVANVYASAAFGAGTSASSTPDAGCRCSACLAAAHGGKGFVRDVVTYTVMDDLTCRTSPASRCSLGVEDLSALEEKTVKIGYQEGLEILKASLQSKTVLTDVFMINRKKRRAGDKHHRPGDKIVDARAPVDKKDAAVQTEKSAPPKPQDFA